MYCVCLCVSTLGLLDLKMFICRLLIDVSFRFAIMSGRGARVTRRNANAANDEVEIPAWLRQCMETIAQNGQAAAANVAQPAIDFPKLCKDFRNLGGKLYLGTESFVETRT